MVQINYLDICIFYRISLTYDKTYSAVDDVEGHPSCCLCITEFFGYIFNSIFTTPADIVMNYIQYDTIYCKSQFDIYWLWSC